MILIRRQSLHCSKGSGPSHKIKPESTIAKIYRRMDDQHIRHRPCISKARRVTPEPVQPGTMSVVDRNAIKRGDWTAQVASTAVLETTFERLCEREIKTALHIRLASFLLTGCPPMSEFLR